MATNSVSTGAASQNGRKSVLILADLYAPGFKGGGPIRSLVNLVGHLGEEFNFKVFSSDRDLGDSHPYDGIRPDVWQNVGHAQVMYLAPKSLTFRKFTRVLRDASTDAVYLNSLFSPTFSIQYLFARRLGVIPNVPTILAPRGELSAGALSIKPLKKRVYLWVAKLLKLFHGVVWQASSEHEAVDIRRQFGEQVTVVVAPDLPSCSDRIVQRKAQPKLPGRLRVVFLSRISRMKNLTMALKVLSHVGGEIDFHIYGPLEDTEYWAECQRLIGSMPPTVRVEYRGVVPHERIFDIMTEYELFLLPTLGENFGHVIVEAFASGCPVLISDRTPWKNLEAEGVGWDISLEQPERFEAALRQVIGMDDGTHLEWSRRAQEFGRRLQYDEAAVAKKRDLFDTVIDSTVRV